MNSNAFLIVVLSVIMAIVVFGNNMLMGSEVKEGFWGASGFQPSVQAFPFQVKPDGSQVALMGNNINPNLGHDFISVPSFQAVLSPRFSNVGYGANIRYNVPNLKNQAVPDIPLTFGNMAKEHYVPSCSGRGNAAPSGNVNAGGDNSMGMASMDSTYVGAGNDLPLGTMTTMSVDGSEQDVNVWQRVTYSGTKPISRIGGLGDHIRGDLPIVPCISDNWSVHPNINTDLQQSALTVLMGVDAQLPLSTYALINKSSAGTQLNLGGGNLANINMGTQHDINLGASLQNTNVTSFA